MATDTLKNIRLGVFVLAGMVFLITALYVIGNKKNLFGKTLRISAEFYNVNGLMVGNNVRFSGIDVGTVESVEIITDSSVRVVMIIEESIREYIKKNAHKIICSAIYVGLKSYPYSLRNIFSKSERKKKKCSNSFSITAQS